MEIGDWRIDLVSGGRFRIDGGTMFGVVPKALWSRACPADANNMIAQETNCVLLRRNDRTMLIDTGYGSKLDKKMRRLLQAEEGDPLQRNLLELGVRPEDVDTVVLSHLHFDHAGGALSRDADDQLVAAFPNAEYVAQRGEWEVAAADLPELRGAYPAENFLSLADSDRLRLIEGEVEIAAGVSALMTPGHTTWHQSILIEGNGQGAVYLGDLCPTSQHLRANWCMAYDVNLLETRRQKNRVLALLADNGWLALFDHDPELSSGSVHRAKRGFALEGRN